MDDIDIFPKDPEPFVALTKTHTKGVNDCCFSPISDQILTAGEDCKVVLWNIPPTDLELHDETIHDEHKLVCYNLEEHKAPVMAVAMQKDLFVSASKDGQAKLWRLRSEVYGEPISGPIKYTCHARSIFSCSIAPDGKSFATSSDDQSIRVWSTECRNKSLFTLVHGHTNWIKCIRHSKIHNSLLASCGDDGKLCIWDLRKQTPCITIASPRRTQYNCLDWHPVFEHHIATGAQDSTCIIWDLRNKKRVQIYAEHTGQVKSVAFNPGGSLLLTGSSDKSSRIFDCLEGRNIFNLLAHKLPISATCFDPTGELFATASADKAVTIWKRNFDTVTIIPDDGGLDTVEDEGIVSSEFNSREFNPHHYEPQHSNLSDPQEPTNHYSWSTRAPQAPRHHQPHPSYHKQHHPRYHLQNNNIYTSRRSHP